MDENRSPQIPRKKRKIGVLLDVSKGRTHNKQVDVHPTRGEIDFSDAHLFENFFEWRTFSAIGTEIEIAEETSNCHGNNDKYYDDSIGEVGDCDDKTAEEEREKGIIKNKDREWKKRDHALFVGYAPLEKPKYSICVIVEHGGSGSVTAAPIAKDIIEKLLI